MKHGVLPASISRLALLSVVAWQTTAARGQSLDSTEANQQLLGTIGTLASAQLYQAYLNIGFIADGKAEGLYDEKTVLPILNSVAGLVTKLEKEMKKTEKLGLSPGDQDSVAEIRRLAALLQTQVKELQAVWKTGDKDHSASYEKARKEAWQGISKLMKL